MIVIPCNIQCVKKGVCSVHSRGRYNHIPPPPPLIFTWNGKTRRDAPWHDTREAAYRLSSGMPAGIGMIDRQTFMEITEASKFTESRNYYVVTCILLWSVYGVAADENGLLVLRALLNWKPHPCQHTGSSPQSIIKAWIDTFWRSLSYPTHTPCS